MKKFIIAAAIVLGTGIFSSCTREVTYQPVASIHSSLFSEKKDLQDAD